MSEPKTAEVKVEDAIVRDIAEQLGASIAGLGFPVGMGTAPPEEMCLRAARGIVALYGRQLSSTAPASPPAETGEGSVGDYVREYEFRGDGGDYTPNEGERLLIEDALHGWISRTHGDDVRGVSFDGDDLSKAFRAGALSAQPVSPSEWETAARDHMSWMRNFVPCVYDVTEERLNEIDAFLTHPASDQSDTERMRADDCSRFVFVEALAKATFAQKHGPTAWRLSNVSLRQQWISRTQDAIQSARAALAEKAADK